MHATGEASDAGRTIARLWDITMQTINGHDPAAVRLLYVLAQYAPNAIPRVMVGGGQPAGDTDERLGLLASYSMITLTSETVSLHRLVQAVVLSTLEEVAADGFSAREVALGWLSAAIPGDPGGNVPGWPLRRALVPHAATLTSRYRRGERPEQLGRVHNEIAVFLDSQGDFVRALALCESPLEIAEAVLVPDHPSVAIKLGNLAVTYPPWHGPPMRCPCSSGPWGGSRMRCLCWNGRCGFTRRRSALTTPTWPPRWGISPPPTVT